MSLPNDPVFRALPCTREAIDAYITDYLQKRGLPPATARYPDEWYADKNNLLDGKPSGWLRREGGKMVWVPMPGDKL